MDAKMLWQLFVETGAPELYMLYNMARKTEGVHVPNDTRTCSAGHEIQ
jgi:hypothetical protein